MIVFDLDPGPPANIVQCAQVGLWVRDIFDHFGLQSFPKTSGSKGLQVYVPLNTPTSYDQTKPFAHAVARLLEHEHPDLVVSDMKKAVRTNKVFVDWSQNDEHKTTISIYSLRARERPTVSTPVTWEEVERRSRRKIRNGLSSKAKTFSRVSTRWVTCSGRCYPEAEAPATCRPGRDLRASREHRNCGTSRSSPRSKKKAATRRAARYNPVRVGRTLLSALCRKRVGLQFRTLIRLRCGRGARKTPLRSRRYKPYGATLRRHLRMGLSKLEARLLSRETRAEEIPQLLRHEAECRRGQLHLSPVGERNDHPELDRRNSRALPLHHQSAPGPHAHQAPEGRRRIPEALSRHSRSAGARQASGPDALPASAQFQSRPGGAVRISEHLPRGVRAAFEFRHDSWFTDAPGRPSASATSRSV